VTHNGMLCDPIQGQGHGGLKLQTRLISKAVSSDNMHVIKRLKVNYDKNIYPSSVSRELQA